MKHSWIAIAGLAAWTACAEPYDDLGSVEAGVYAIDGWHLNEDGCDADGRSLLGVRVATHVAIAEVSDGGEPFVAVEPCTGDGDCGAALAAIAAGTWPYVELRSGNRDDGFAGDDAGTTATGDVCRYWDATSTLVTVGGTARFERRTAYVDRPRDGLLCLFQDPPASHGGCRELETLTATRVAELP